jgi:hypothetical protein
MDNIKLERLKEILSIPSFYGREEKVREYISEWATVRNIPFYIDDIGNIYLTKGLSGSYPCMVAHMDTVHVIQHSGIDIVEETYQMSAYDRSSVCNGKQVLRGYLKGGEHTYINRTGCGGDDKAGIFLALEIMDKFDVMKCAFFISEEIGCIGSSKADPNFFENVAYAIQHDSPENDTISWYCSGYLLFNEKWAKPGIVVDMETGEECFDGEIGDLLYKYGVRTFARHPYTDVSQLKKKFDFQCINLPAAYYHYHSSNECVLIEGIETAFELSVAIIERLGNEKQTFEQQEQNYGSNSNGYTYGYGGSNTNSNSSKILSTIEMKKKIMKYFQKKYNMTDDEFIFLYDGLYSFIDNFEGKSTITEIIEEYKESAFYN